MATISCIFFHKPITIPASDLSIHLQSTMSIENEAYHAFLLPTDDHFWLEVDQLRELSGMTGADIIHIAYQSYVDGFVYSRLQSGVLQRCLKYGCDQEKIWETVSGEPDGWEQDLWGQGVITEGATSHGVDVIDIYISIEAYYQLPKWV